MSESRKRLKARSDTVPLISDREALPRRLSEPNRKVYRRASDQNLKSLVQGNEPPAKPPRGGIESPTKPRNGGHEPVAKSTRQESEGLPNVESAQIPSAYNKLGREPRRMICQICGSSVITRVQWKPSLRTHAVALLLCLFVLWPCVCVPYCTPACLDITHYCPNCNSIIGTAN